MAALDRGEEALKAFEPYRNPRANGLSTVIRRSLNYATVDKARAEIVIDKQALLRAIVDVGLTEPADLQTGNAATWFVEWLRPHVGDLERRFPRGAAPSLAATMDMAQRETAVVASASVQGLLKAAQEVAQRTVKRAQVDLRHLIVPLLRAGTPLDWESFGWVPGQGDIRGYFDLMLQRLARSHERGESMAAWRAVLELLPAGAPEPPNAADANLSGFTADRPRSTVGLDPLGVEADVEAFARLIAFSGTGTPLSIGVFGGWGSGKSSFMERLADKIDELTEQAGPAHAGDRILGKIVQVRFNAWHFADANLWASLTAEFFDQLRSGGYARRPAAIHASLVERVNAHVHDLSVAAGATRKALSEGEKKLAEAQKARDRVVRSQPADLSQKLVNGLAEAYEANKQTIARIAGRANAPDAAKDLETLIGAAKAAPSWLGRLKVIGAAAAARPVRTAVFIGLAVIGAALFFTPAAFGLQGSVLDWAASRTVGAMAALGGLALAARPGVQLLGIVIRGTAGMVEEIKTAEQGQLAAVLKAEAELKAAAAEAEARREKAAEAGAALARYIDPAGMGNPPRLLRYMLDDNPDTRSLEKEIGLIGRTRRLFEAVDRIVEEELGKGQAADKDTPERIVLYIDDLDRCTYRQVYDVLQAVHLLLAFKLFVVVVAVDVNWVAEALADQFDLKAREGEADTELHQRRRRRAVQYLEKIFQLPFWIKPLGGGADGAYGRFVRQLAAPAAHTAVATIGEFRDEAGVAGGVVTGDDEAAPDLAPARARPVEEREGAAEAQILRTLQLDPEELDFLASDALAEVASKTPRGVLRMINIYRIVRLTPLISSDGFTPVWPLVALFAAIETGCDPETADALFEALQQVPAQTLLDPHMRSEEAAKTSLAFARSRLATVFERNPAIRAAAVKAAEALNYQGIQVGDYLAAARAVRRYSFNRY